MCHRSPPTRYFQDAKFRLILVESRVHRISRYYKKVIAPCLCRLLCYVSLFASRGSCYFSGVACVAPYSMLFPRFLIHHVYMMSVVSLCFHNRLPSNTWFNCIDSTSWPGRQACPYLEVRFFHCICHGRVKRSSRVSQREFVN